MQFANLGRGSAVLVVGRDSAPLAKAFGVKPRAYVERAISNRLDGVSPYRLDRTGTHGCNELRINYFGNAMLVRPLVKYWVPVIAWMLLIFGASGDSMSAEHTSRFLTPFLLWLNPDISVETVSLIRLSVRKTAHLTEYAVLALLLSRAVFRGTNFKWTRSTLFVSTWIVCVLVATCDEFRQSFVESRDASPWDVMIDSVGAIFGLLIYSWFWGARARRALVSAPRRHERGSSSHE